MSRRTTRSTAAFEVGSSSGSSVAISNGIAQSTIMHISSQYSHPAFSKLYLGASYSQNGKAYAGSSGAVPKPPKPPEKPLMPYMRYSRKVWDDVKANQPDLKLWEIGKIIGKMWRELPASDKQLYIDEYEAEKLDYHEQLKFYHNSPAYQGYLQAKARAEAEAAESKAADGEESCMSIEAADDGVGDTDEGFSVKHVAAARFQRNHRLMQDICADVSVISNGRGIVTEKRLNVLRSQVQSLKRHQAKLQDELMDIEKTHALTKGRWKEQSNTFHAEMKRLRIMSPQEYYMECKKKQQQQQLSVAKDVGPLSASLNKSSEDKPKVCVKADNALEESTEESTKDLCKTADSAVPCEKESTMEEDKQCDEQSQSLGESSNGNQGAAMQSDKEADTEHKVCLDHSPAPSIGTTADQDIAAENPCQVCKDDDEKSDDVAKDG